jgi:ABC-2 type transport system ATP-binding protein
MRLLLRSSIQEPVVALDDVSLEVAAGRICAIVGPNGAGKSTLFRILTGLTTPTSGFATVCGLDVTHRSFEVRKLVGFAPPDDQSLLSRNTCRENLFFHGQLRGIPKKDLRRRVEELLELVGLGPARNRVAVALSSGMRARLQLARALLHRPKVLILDEPTSSVDPIAAFELLGIIKDAAAEQGSAALISSHRLDEIEALNDDVVLLDQGKVVYRGDLDSLRGIWEEPHLEIQFDSPEACGQAALVLDRLSGVEVVAVDSIGLTLRTSLGVGKLFALSNGELSGIRSIRESRMPLRELLMLVLRNSAEVGKRPSSVSS